MCHEWWGPEAFSGTGKDIIFKDMLQVIFGGGSQKTDSQATFFVYLLCPEIPLSGVVEVPSLHNTIPTGNSFAANVLCHPELCSHIRPPDYNYYGMNS